MTFFSFLSRRILVLNTNFLAMHRSGTGFCKLGFRVRAEKKFEREERKDEINKYPQLGCNAEQAVHLIPFILLACLLVLYIFSYTPVEGQYTIFCILLSIQLLCVL